MRRPIAKVFLAKPLEIDLAGLQIGPYVLERMVGEGGMGSVWLARRADGRFEGRAAVKLLNLSLLSNTGQERFRREGSALARLAHPGIARLLDAGVSDSGQPYLILEYIDGRPLDEYVESNHLTTDERLALFLRVLDAVGHAHTNLIVHRDLKPSNILVTRDGAPKLLDFGVAKLLEHDSSSGPSTITFEGAAAFTPRYAAPEQVRGEPVTTATDIYALGVILYMLIAGEHPTAGDSTTPEDTMRALLEVKPERVDYADLDLIIEKALQKVPAARYQTTTAFAEDIMRYRNHEPVTARRDSFVYRSQKFIRRHRTSVSLAVIVFVALLSAMTFSITQAREAKLQRDAAVDASKRADAQAEFAAMLMSQVGERPITVREILDRARQTVQHQYVGDPSFITSALLQLSTQYADLGDNTVRAGLLASAESIAVATHDRPRYVEVQCNIADNLRSQGKYDDAEALLARTDSMRRDIADPNLEATCLYARAEVSNEIGKSELSAPAIHRAIAIRDSLGQTRDMFYIKLLVDLGYTLDRQNRAREDIDITNRAIALMDTTGRGQTTLSAITRHDLAVTYNGLGETAHADSMLHDVLRRLSQLDTSGHYPNQTLIHYAHLALYQGDADSARKYFGALAEQAVGDHNKYWEGRALFGKAEAEIAAGRLADARATIARFRPIASEPTLHKSDDQVVNVNTLDALVAMSAGDTAKANTLIQQVLTTYGYYKGRRSGVLHSTLMLASQAALALHHPDSALVFARDARKSATHDSLTETRSARVGEARLIEARAELQQHDTSAARADIERAVVALRSGAGPAHFRTREAETLASRIR